MKKKVMWNPIYEVIAYAVISLFGNIMIAQVAGVGEFTWLMVAMSLVNGIVAFGARLVAFRYGVSILLETADYIALNERYGDISDRNIKNKDRIKEFLLINEDYKHICVNELLIEGYNVNKKISISGSVERKFAATVGPTMVISTTIMFFINMLILGSITDYGMLALQILSNMGVIAFNGWMGFHKSENVFQSEKIEPLKTRIVILTHFEEWKQTHSNIVPVLYIEGGE